jgi:spermidine synthase/S-adenosylmethionine decarboxylase proenzyme
LCELSGCDPQLLTSVEAVKTALEGAAKRANVTILHGYFHRFTPLGVSGLLCIAESHISIHTWPELGYCAADIYTCGDHTLPRSAPVILANALHAKHTDLLEVTRGTADEGGIYRSVLGDHTGSAMRPARNNGINVLTPPLVDDADPNQRHVYAVSRWLAEERSEFHHIEICETKSFGRLLALDGAIQSSECDEHIYHETLVHPAMLLHGKPQRVLILGGGEGASLREVLRHASVQRATMIDIDGRLVNLCRQHLPEWSAGTYDDPRTQLVIADGKAWVEACSEQFDVIVMDLTDQVDLGPSFPLYTQAFFRQLRQRLARDGVLVVQAGELSPADNFSHCTIRRTLATVFPQVRSYAQFIPAFAGEWSFVLATATRVELPSAAAIDSEVARRLQRPLRFFEGRANVRMFTLAREVEAAFDRAGIVNTDADAFARARARIDGGEPPSAAADMHAS